MTRVDFYVAQGQSEKEWLSVACRLVEKAWRKQHSVYVHTGDAQAMQQFDALLWSFRPNSFIPHRSETTAPLMGTQPEVLVACSGQPGDHHDVLVNLTHATP
ncbi:MAG: DNA polymerase III subunit chi, partial [Pseudomonadales bacterium]